VAGLRCGTSRCPTFRYLKLEAVAGEDPEANCNEVGDQLDDEGVKIDSCPLQFVADRPRN
jgi:hypothetical protein